MPDACYTSRAYIEFFQARPFQIDFCKWKWPAPFLSGWFPDLVQAWFRPYFLLFFRNRAQGEGIYAIFLQTFFRSIRR